MAEDDTTSSAESRKSRLELLRERQKKLRESYKSQIQISRKTLTTETTSNDVAAAAAIATAAVTPDAITIPEGDTVTPIITKTSLSFDAEVPITPKSISPRLEVPLTPTSTSIVFLQLQEKNEELKRQLAEVKSDRDSLLTRQKERFESASNQLNELEELLEDYRMIAEETEEINAVLKAKNSLLTSENNTLKKDNEKLQKQVDKQEERILESCHSMSDLENDLMKTTEELEISERNVRTLQNQVRSLSTPVSFPTHQQTTYYPPQQATYYPPPETSYQFDFSSMQQQQQPFGGGGPRGPSPQNIPNFQQYNDNSSGQGQRRNTRNGNTKKKRR